MYSIYDGRKQVNRLHSVISNRDINMSARRLLLLAGVRPTLEYGSEVWRPISLRQLRWSLWCWEEQSVFLGVHLGRVTRQSGVIWALIHYRGVEIGIS